MRLLIVLSLFFIPYLSLSSIEWAGSKTASSQETTVEIKIAEWKDPPLPPPPKKKSPIRKKEPTIIRYDHYKPGQVHLKSPRLKRLLNEVQWYLRRTKSNKETIHRIVIHGYSDAIKIAKHNVIWMQLPKSIRPSHAKKVTNEVLASGRAVSIREKISQNLRYRLPTKIEIKKTANLPKDARNRRVEIHIYTIINSGI